MRTVTLGRTGLNMNPIGFGGIPIQRITTTEASELIEYAIQKGINFIDTARGYTDSEVKIGNVLPRYRSQVVIATKSMARDKAGMAADIDLSLSNLQVDCIDLYQLHNIRTMEALEQVLQEDGAYAALKEAQAQGKIRYIGITGHKPSVLVEAVRRDLFDTVQVAFNIIETEPLNELIPLCQEKNVGVIVMKPVAGGALKNHVPASLKFILNHPVTAVIPGMDSKTQVDENLLAILHPELTEKEACALQTEADALGAQFCRKCDYCAPCPQGIDIPSNFVLDAYYTRYSMPEWATGRYQGQKVNAGACIECGACEAKCPYDLPIIKMLKSVHQHMG